jgi:hypothetical protein
MVLRKRVISKVKRLIGQYSLMEKLTGNRLERTTQRLRKEGNVLPRDSFAFSMKLIRRAGKVSREQKQKNNQSMRSGNNSPWKLTGLGKDAVWEKRVDRAITAQRHPVTNARGKITEFVSDAAVEMKNIQQWNNKSAEKKKAMEDWLEKHQEWVKKNRAKK